MWQPTLKHSPLNFCTKQIMAVLRSLTCAAVILSLLQENNLSNSIPRRVKCRTKAVNHLSRSKIFIEAKIYKLTESVIPHQALFQHELGYVRPTISHESSSHKTWQTSLLFLKPLQMQNLKRKKWGSMVYYVPPPEKVGRHVPRVPHQIAPMNSYISWSPSYWSVK